LGVINADTMADGSTLDVTSSVRLSCSAVSEGREYCKFFQITCCISNLI